MKWKWNYINTKGRWVIPSRFYSVIYSFSDNGLAWVRENEKSIFINAKGETVASIDDVCDLKVLKNARGEIIWPQKTEAQICEEQKAK